jgi:ubiquinone/menaquinone biosynthesis C-methylase UbiE
MPVDGKVLANEQILYQRQQYEKGGIGRLYWDYRDREIMRHVEGNRMLDIGCGEGVTLGKMVDRFPEKTILGIDSLQENVDICRKHDLPVENGDVYDLRFTDGSVDCCLLIEVIEHLEDHRKALKEIHRVLRKGGLLILLFPNDRNFKISRMLTGKLREAFYDAGHVRQWTPVLMKSALESIGFRILEMQNLPFWLWTFSLHSIVVADKIIREKIERV